MVLSLIEGGVEQAALARLVSRSIPRDQRLDDLRLLRSEAYHNSQILTARKF